MTCFLSVRYQRDSHQMTVITPLASCIKGTRHLMISPLVSYTKGTRHLVIKPLVSYTKGTRYLVTTPLEIPEGKSSNDMFP
jgi:hypothetical protein